LHIEYILQNKNAFSMIAYEELSLNYLEKISQARSEAAKKELFYQLLMQFYANDAEAQSLITLMMQGAETTIKNIPLPKRNKTGRADTQYNQVIIEFEKDLKKTEAHAKVQLQEYVAGNWNSANVQDFTLIATDCERWCVYAISPESFLTINVKNVEHIKIELVQDYVLSEENAQDFFYFLDTLLFRTLLQKPTLQNINNDFGAKSNVFRYFLANGKGIYQKIKQNTEIQTAYNEWEKFLSIAYGNFQGSDEVFLIHTYLSVFAKLLGYMVVSKTPYIQGAEIPDILNGNKFSGLKISNYTENDFYQWIQTPDYYKLLEKEILQITLKLSDYKFENIEGDILKGVYQGLIDIETRQSLGEYYTPDWLCEQVVSHFQFERTATMMDPSCGSGSFLLAMMKHLHKQHPDISAAELAAQVIGIDIHPLSVQIAKTTLLIGLQDILNETEEPILLRIYLANSIIMREDTVGLFEAGYRIKIDNESFWFSKHTFQDTDFFDTIISMLDKAADRSLHSASLSLNEVTENCKNLGANVHITADDFDSFHQLYLKLKKAKESGRDNIWKYVLQNNYKPYFLSKKFDYIIGNPPWFTYNSISNSDYQKELKQLSDNYHITPSPKNMPHLEIAAIFMAHCGDYYLKSSGKMAFVMPRSFLQADQHKNTREGKVTGVNLSEIWDLKDVKNLFNIPSCVLFTDSATADKKNNLFLKKGLKGRTYAGKPPYHNATWAESKKSIRFTSNKWFYSELGNNSALTTTRKNVQEKENYYAQHFKQGATLVPRNFYFVQIDDRAYPFKSWSKRVTNLITDPSNDKDGKAPWKGFKLCGYMDAIYVFRSALAKNILPFAAIHLPFVTLPIAINETPSAQGMTKSIQLLGERQMMNRVDDRLSNYWEGRIKSSDWFWDAGKFWDKNKTEKNKNVSYLDWINWHNKLTNQNLNKRYLVLYTASAKDATACIIDRTALDREFIVESATYVYYTDDLNQANYICAFLHSPMANLAIKDFQPTGLFGPRHVNKRILDVYLPKYDETKPSHLALAQLGARCVQKVADYLQAQDLKENNYNVGRVRTAIRELLGEDLAEIDAALNVIYQEA
jgi:type I restriction-modification system DNA methylase subunit